MKLLVVADLNYASPRIPGLVTPLTDSGWDVTILTAPVSVESLAELRLGGCELLEVGEPSVAGGRRWQAVARAWTSASPALRLVHRLARALRSFCLRILREVAWYPDRQRRWGRPAYRAGLSLMREHSDTVIMSSSSPVTCHVVASRLARATGAAWLADLRDLWSQNHAYYFSPLRRVVDRRLELRTMARARGLVTVSSPLVDQLRQLHPHGEVSVVRNGYDPATYDADPPSPTEDFTLTYTGQVYPGYQDPGKLFEALVAGFSSSALERSRTKLRFVGPPSDVLMRAVERYGLGDVVAIGGQVARSRAAAMQRESQVLLMFNWEDASQTGIYSQKVFEYLGARRPILAVGGYRAAAARELIETTRSGRYCTTVDETLECLTDLFMQYQRSGQVQYTGVEDEIQKLSFPSLARELEEALNRAIRASRHDASPP